MKENKEKTHSIGNLLLDFLFSYLKEENFICDTSFSYFERVLFFFLNNTIDHIFPLNLLGKDFHFEFSFNLDLIFSSAFFFLLLINGFISVFQNFSSFSFCS